MIKTIHVATASISIVGFMLRGYWMMLGSPKLTQRWVKTVPHIVDTMLLATAIVLAVRLQQYPFVDAWLTAKVIGLLVYIGLGFVALHFGKTIRLRTMTWLAAIVVYIYIVAVAITRNPLVLL